MIQERKVNLRLLLNALDFQTFFQHALDHFCSTIDKPFDFVQASLSKDRLSSAFSQNIVTIAVSMINSRAKPRPPVVFEKMSFFIASCIMLDAVRHDIRGMPLVTQVLRATDYTAGAADRIFSKYTAQVDATVIEIRDKYWPCEHRASAQPRQSTAANWDNMYLFQLNDVVFDCTKVRIGHGTSHQLENGFHFAPGDYESNFSIETDRAQILNGIYFRLHHLLERLSRHSASMKAQLDAVAKIHLSNLKTFFGDNEMQGFQLAKFCISCLVEPAYSIMPCGHSFCKECIRAYGRSRSKTVVELYECPIHSKSSPPVKSLSSAFVWGQSRSIYIAPRDAGMRMLSLDE